MISEMIKILRPFFAFIFFAAVLESQAQLKAEVINPPDSSSGSVDLNENSGQKYPNGSTSYTLTPVNGTPEAYFPYGVTYYVLEKGSQHDSKIIFDVLYGSSDPTMFLYKGLFIPETINYSNVLGQNDDTGQDQHPGGRTSCQTSPTTYCPLVEFSVGSRSNQVNYDTLYSVVGSVFSYSSSLPTPFNLNVTDGILVAEPDLGELSEYLIGIDKSGSQFNTVSEVVNGDIFPDRLGGEITTSKVEEPLRLNRP